ncbi:MAG: hypothetical protein K6U12_10270 [Armatimonadetes bacterium]|nr:hypothetical protein [Armatimonadota bacterium]
MRKQFVNWLRGYLYTRCLIVDPQPTDESRVNFRLFPAALEHANFHQDDRKFVAVAIAAQQATGQTVPILNAIDSDWCHHYALLLQNGIQVHFLCPDRMPSDECR